MKSVSYDKESLKLIVIRPTFTDVINSWSINTTSDDPTVLTLNIETKSGVGKKHKAVLRAYNFPEKKIITRFRLSQSFIFNSLREGEFYTIDLTAYSKGTLPLIREYTYNDFTYPAQPQLGNSGQPEVVQTTSLTWQFWSMGVKHNWVLSYVSYF